MGMFDSVNVRCPHCKEIHEAQSKSGPCSLKTYTLKTAPLSVMGEILGDYVCWNCRKCFRIELVNQPTYRTVPLKMNEYDELEVLVDEDDMD